MDHNVKTQYIRVNGQFSVTVNSEHYSALYLEKSARLAYQKAYAECRLYERYFADISAWDWQGVLSDARDNPREPDFDNEPSFGYCYLGTVFGLCPSGKFYTPWAHSNVTESEAYQDELFYAALDAIAESHGLWIENGEDDPCDIFAVCDIEPVEPADES